MNNIFLSAEGQQFSQLSGSESVTFVNEGSVSDVLWCRPHRSGAAETGAAFSL